MSNGQPQERQIQLRIDEVRHEPGRIQVPGGVPSRGVLTYRFYLTGHEGDKVTLRYTSDRAKAIEQVVELRAPDKTEPRLDKTEPRP